MKITGFSLYRYDLALVKPLYVAGHELAKREGLIIRIVAEDGTEGFGEIAPLVFLSTEKFDDALDQAQRLRQALLNQIIPPNLHAIKGGFRKWLGKSAIYPSVQFGLEMAVLNLMANKKQVSLGRLLDESIYEKILVNGFLHGNKEEVKKQATDLIDRGFKALKLKVGKNLDEEIAKVQALNELIVGKAILHLDANQSWDINKAVQFGHEVGLATVDYIEEPFSDLEGIPDFFMKTTIPVAADESFLLHPISKLKSIPGLEVVIVKPTLLGGIERTVHLIKEAQSCGLSTVISSCYESSIGILALANLAGVASRHQGAGLDTLKFFKEDLFKEPIVIDHGKIDISTRNIHSGDINFNHLKEIP